MFLSNGMGSGSKSGMTKVKAIGFDMDGVIFDHSELKRDILKTMGYEVSLEETASLIVEKKLGEEKYREMQYLLYDDPKVALRPKLMPRVKEVLERARQQGVPFYLISKRHHSEIPQLLLKKYDLWPNYFNEKNVNFVKKKEDKNDVAVKYGVSHYIDDKIDYLDVVTAVPNRYLFDPFGVFVGQHSYTHIGSWPEFIKKVL